ncbi:MAG: hypothetical protein K8F91_10570, partial [Candidatus Obscuribacterales bacterium]|nr:hypothetical protein [Candidatus Obscuribacterales bacterium]
MSPDKKINTENGQVHLPVEPHHDIFPNGPEFLAWLGAGLCGIVLLFFALTAGQLFNRGILPGDVAERDILVPEAASVIDPIATKQAVENARHLVVPVLQRDRSRDEDTVNQMDSTMRFIRKLHSKGIDPIPELKDAFHVTFAEHRYLLTCSDSAFDKIVDGRDVASLKGLDQSIANKFGYVREKIDRLNADTGRRSRRTSSRKARELTQALTIVEATLSEQRLSYKQLSVDEDPNIKYKLLIALIVDPGELSDYYKTSLDATRRLLLRFERFPVSDKGIWADTVYEFLPDSWDG